MSESRDTDVDVRFLLANERTLLAWVRTSLTLLAVGAGLVEFATQFAGRRALAAVLLVAGSAAAATGAVRYARADRAVRAHTLPPAGRAPYVLAACVGLAGLALLVGLFVS